MTNETAQPTNGGSNDQLGHIVDALASLRRQLHERAAADAESPLLLTTARAAALLGALEAAPSAIMDTRHGLGVCAEREDDFPALYALKGRRVLLVDLGPNGQANLPATRGPQE